jgi:hypothetical protein
MECPKCKLDLAHRSHRKGLWERGASVFGYFPYRCFKCNFRFLVHRYAKPGMKPGEPTSTEKEIRATRMKMKRKRKVRELTIYSFGLLIFLAFLYYITRPDMGG